MNTKTQINAPKASKINWTAAVSSASTLMVLLIGPEFEISPEQQLAVVAGITILTNTAVKIMRTYFTTNV